MTCRCDSLTSVFWKEKKITTQKSVEWRYPKIKLLTSAHGAFGISRRSGDVKIKDKKDGK